MFERQQIQRGMVVRSADGRNLGRVLVCEEGSFVVEKGFFFVTDYTASYDDVAQISGDEIRLSRSPEDLPHGEHAVVREGGLGESFTLGAHDLAGSSQPQARADETEPEARRGVRGDEDEPGPGYRMGKDSGGPLAYGDEGGGGLL